jgi:uncharacterized membrane protein
MSEPWFRQRPVIALSVAGALFAAVLVLRLRTGDPADAYSLLYVLPVALVAVSFGARAGAAAGVLAVALMIVWVRVDDVTLSATGWATRALPMLLLGVLVGDASDRVRRAEADGRRLAAAALLHREAIEINDSLIQGMAAVRWSLEAGRVDAGMSTLDDTNNQAHRLVSELIRQADMGGRTEAIGERARS